MADEIVPTATPETQAPAEAPPIVAAPPMDEISELTAPEIIPAPAPDQNAQRGIEWLRQQAEEAKQLREEVRQMRAMVARQNADPLADPIQQPSAEPPDYVKQIIEQNKQTQELVKRQQQEIAQDRGSATFQQQSIVAQGLVDQFAASPDSKLFAVKEDSSPELKQRAEAMKNMVSQRSGDRIKAELGYGIQQAVQQGKSPLAHGVSADRARAIFVEEYNNAVAFARMFSAPAQVAQQAAVNAAQGTPAGGSTPAMGQNQEQEPDIRNREAWLEFQAKRGASLWTKQGR